MLSRAVSSLARHSRAGRYSFIAAAAPNANANANAKHQPRLSLATGGAVQLRGFSEKNDSHDDFAPQKKSVTDDVDGAVEMIRQHVTDNPIMLYMKGNPSMPMCGFSAKIVQTLQAEGVDFSSVNVLDYPSIREGVKKFASWPTIPQLYINGEFIGGNDIVSEMHESGELKELLAEVKAAEKE